MKQDRQTKAPSYIRATTFMEYQKALPAIRNHKKISAAYVAEEIGVTASHYCDIEKGRKILSMSLFCEIAAILKLTPVGLMIKCEQEIKKAQLTGVKQDGNRN